MRDRTRHRGQQTRMSVRADAIRLEKVGAADDRLCVGRMHLGLSARYDCVVAPLPGACQFVGESCYVAGSASDALAGENGVE